MNNQRMRGQILSPGGGLGQAVAVRGKRKGTEQWGCFRALDMVVRVSAAYLSPSLAFTCALTSVLSVSLMKGIPAVWSKM